MGRRPPAPDDDEDLFPPRSRRRLPFHWPFREGEVRLFDVAVLVVTLALIGAGVAWALGLL